jgi:Zn-dependent protease with chaperone function
MNFFDAQDQARRSTRRLVLAYITATIIIVAGVTAIVGFGLYAGGQYVDQTGQITPGQFVSNNPGLFASIALVATLFILGSSLFKTSRLSAGGGRVAVDMGGTQVPTDVQDPLRRRLRNVVEEMAIASGVPVPEIYVMEQEHGINAFAAGFSPSDAAIAVTRGTLELLDRDELQGVIAHEFSHILNGDMKLNIRLMGVLFGIMVLGLIGRLIMRGGFHASIVSSRRDRGSAPILMVGIGLVILGGIGVFFARMIKAGVSRQREFLADASAVQFTRQSAGIAGALKKIGGYSGGSKISATDPEEVSHMLFGSGAGLSSMFATHPPLVDRIQALDPTFKEGDFPQVDRRRRKMASATESQHAAFAGDVTTALATGGTRVLADSIAASVGQPQKEHVDFARDLRASIPETLYEAAHSSEFAYLLAVSLILDRSGKVTERQFALIQEQLGSQRSKFVRRYFDDLNKIGPEYRLPLLEIAFPALKLRPAQELEYLVSLTTRLIEADGEIELFEFCFYRIMMSNLGRAIDPTGKRAASRSTRRELQAATIDLLRLLADYGHEVEAERIAAFAAGLKTLGPWAHDAEFTSDRKVTVAVLSASLDILLGLNSKGQDSLLRAVSATAAHDGKLSVSEAELVRAVCATLNYPLPPILVHR